MKAALKLIGFADVVEVGWGADRGTVEEVHHYAKHAVSYTHLDVYKRQSLPFSVI